MKKSNDIDPSCVKNFTNDESLSLIPSTNESKHLNQLVIKHFLNDHSDCEIDKKVFIPADTLELSRSPSQI